MVQIYLVHYQILTSKETQHLGFNNVIYNRRNDIAYYY